MSLCAVCQGTLEGHGANPWPLRPATEHCCRECDLRFVLPARLLDCRDPDDSRCRLLVMVATLGQATIDELKNP